MAVIDTRYSTSLDDGAVAIRQVGAPLTDAGPADWAGSLDPIQVYMRDVGRHPLLTADEEKLLATAMIHAGQARARLDYETDPEERGRLAQVIADGQMAQERLANCNLRLVISQANRQRNNGVSFLDLIQEGNVGLMKAVEKFDPTRGFKFSTYATWWIRQSISRALADQARTIRLPVHVVDKLKKIERTRKHLRGLLGRDPSLLELCLETGHLDRSIEELIPDWVLTTDACHLVADEDVRAVAEEAVDRVRNLLSLDTAPVSLYSPVHHGEDALLLDIVEDENSPEPAEAASIEIMKEQVNDVLNDLDPRERGIINNRFGLDDQEPLTLDDLGKEFDITRERVRQIVKEALQKIYAEDCGRHLREFII